MVATIIKNNRTIHKNGRPLDSGNPFGIKATNVMLILRPIASMILSRVIVFVEFSSSTTWLCCHGLSAYTGTTTNTGATIAPPTTTTTTTTSSTSSTGSTSSTSQ